MPAATLAPDGRAWAPDLCRETIGPKITAADRALLQAATAHGASLRQVLGVSPGKRGITTLRQLLALAGHRLEAKPGRWGPRLALPRGAGSLARWGRSGPPAGRMARSAGPISRGADPVPKNPLQIKGDRWPRSAAPPPFPVSAAFPVSTLPDARTDLTPGSNLVQSRARPPPAPVGSFRLCFLAGRRAAGFGLFWPSKRVAQVANGCATTDRAGEP